MELMFKLEEDEALSNFAVADAIYFHCKGPTNDNLDPVAIANMLLEQIKSDERRKI